MKSTSGYGASGLASETVVMTQPIEGTETTVGEGSGYPTNSTTQLHSSTICEKQGTLTMRLNTNLKSTESTTMDTTNGGTSGGQQEPTRPSTPDAQSSSGTTTNACSSGSLSRSIATSVSHVLEACISKVSRLMRSLGERVAQTESGFATNENKIPVYDIINAGPRHRFLSLKPMLSNCVLGLGYGMGAVKFVDNCKSQGLELHSLPRSEWPEINKRLLFILRNVAKIKDPFEPANEYKVGQVIYSDKVVSEWRSANNGIVGLWHSLEEAFKTRAIAEMDTVSFRLPSGRIKTYWKPRMVKELTTEVDENGKEHPSYRLAMQATVVRGKPRTFLTGGNLLENIVQATCRDIMTYGAIEIERKHPLWKFCWSCYDEVIFEVPEPEVEEALATMPELMCQGDLIKEWTEGLPLEVEGGAFDRYCK